MMLHKLNYLYIGNTIKFRIRIPLKTMRYFLLFFLLIAGVFAFSQKQRIHFENIGTNAGLSQSNVICIFQDSRGFMWFGTRDGLNKYDGYKFTLYKYDADDDQSISQSTIHGIVEDDEGNLWISAWGGGLDMFDRDTEKFIHHRVDFKYPFNIASTFISSLVYGSDGNIWIGTEGSGLEMYSRKTNKFIAYTHNENDPKSLSNNVIKAVTEDSKHNIWAGTLSGGLELFDRKTKSFTHFKHETKNAGSLFSDSIWTLFIDHQDRLWIGFLGGGLDMFDNDKKTFIHYRNNPADVQSIQPDLIRAINEDDHGNLWIGTENGGLSIFNTQSGLFEKYIMDDADKESINDNSIWSVCKDNKKNMWVGTFGAGINIVHRDANNFKLYRHNSSTFSLNNNRVLSILEDSKNNLWIGTDGGGMNLFDPKKGTFTHYMQEPSNRNSIGGNYVLKIFEDSHGNLWIGTWGNGLTVYNKEKNTYQHFKYDPAKPKGLGGNNVWAIAEDADKNIWIGFYNSSSGVDMFDKKTNSFIHYSNDLLNTTSISNNIVNTIFKGKNGNLWIGTNGGGLDLFNQKTKTFTHINAQTSGISNNEIYCLIEDREENLWIGTHLGLNRMDKRTGSITKYYVKDGLPSNTITGLLADEKGYLWISTYNGLSRFDPVQKVFKNFGINNGLQSNEFKMNSCYKSRSGKMYFGGINGFNEFLPESVKEIVYEPPLVFTDFQIFNKQVLVSGGGKNISPLTKSITETRELVLSYKQSVISFEFASLNFTGQNKKQYAYMLVGFDKDWNDIGSKHIATYTNLDPGTYLLKVRGLNNEGKWSAKIAEIKITITPPYWETWWFRSIIIITILGSAYTFYKFRIRAVNAQKTLLEKQVAERTESLAMMTENERKARREADEANTELGRKNKELEEFAYIASHDLQEPLRTTSSFIQLLQQRYSGQLDEKADKYFNFILDASERMKLLIKNMLEYSRLGNNKEMEQVDCNKKLQEVIADLGIAIKEAGALITYDSLPILSGYPLELKQLFQNLVTNAIKFRKKDTQPELNISVKKVPGFWEFAFKDNGIGLDEKHSEKIFVIFQRLHTRTEYEGSGIGLSHCKKIAELHHGRIWLKSAPGQGSTFYFTLSTGQNGIKETSK